MGRGWVDLNDLPILKEEALLIADNTNVYKNLLLSNELIKVELPP